MMNKGAELPDALLEDTEASIRESLALLEKWHGRADGRIRYCFAPRFAISCTRDLLERVSILAKEHRVMIHTHASENRTEIEIVERETGQRNVAYLDSLGIAGPHVLLAHCVHLDDHEIQLILDAGTHVAHCPSSNLKLGSGIARIKEMVDQGVSVSFGADGAPCNNRLDMWTEMRTAALLQKVQHGAEALPARTVLRMATMGGSHALGIADEVGSLEVGKRADVAIVDLKRLHATPRPQDITSVLVYSVQPSDVTTVIIDGEIVMRDRVLMTLNEKDVIDDANREASLLMKRAGL
jgi:5-methylthioadenosine/S-adenosylhomocysteine deaminase